MDRPSTLDTDPVIRHFMEDCLPRLRDAFAPSEVWLFGSRVRGDALEESDLDVVVVAESFAPIPWVERMAAVSRAARPDRWMEFLCYTPSEFAEKREQLCIVQAAVEEGFRVL